MQDDPWFRHVSVRDKRKMIALVWKGERARKRYKNEKKKNGEREREREREREKEKEKEKERSPPRIAACCCRDIKIFLIRVRSRLPCFFNPRGFFVGFLHPVVPTNVGRNVYI